MKSMAYIRKLTAFLVISGSINIILMAILFYWSIAERPPRPYFELKPATSSEELTPLAIDKSDSEVIRYFRRKSMDWLIFRLKDTTLVENGYTQRDLALASLVAFHHFDLDRALGNFGRTFPDFFLNKGIQKKIIRYGKFQDGSFADLIVYPGLTEQHFDAIIKFAETEKWPLTPKGLFMALQRQESKDLAMADMMMMTSEFNLVEVLFSRTHILVDKEELLNVILDGKWEQLTDFVQHQKAVQDLSAAKRQAFLLSYIHNQSKAAALLLLKTDEVFAAKKLDDKQVLGILHLLDEKTKESENFALTLLTSPRSDEVLKAAAIRLYEYAKESLPSDSIIAKALAKFAPNHTFLSFETKEDKKESNLNLASKTLPVAEIRTLQKLQISLPKQKALPPPKSTNQPAPKASLDVRQKSLLVSKSCDYVIQDGDSLWKISRKFNVDVEVIKAYNQIDANSLRPGRTLRIPVSNLPKSNKRP